MGRAEHLEFKRKIVNVEFSRRLYEVGCNASLG